MSPEFKKLYSISSSLAKLAKTEYGNSFIGSSKIIRLIKGDHFAGLLMSKLNSDYEKIKTLVLTYLLLNRPNFNVTTLEAILLNLYVTRIDFYEETVAIKTECDHCYGSGEEECDQCGGSGKEDCSSCDGEGSIECSECDGEGKEDCRYCDGNGSETEEDDEGNEVEVECAHCDGEGKENCRSCGGSGEYECPSCDGAKHYDCNHCNGYGEYSCGYCDGYGEVDSDELKYNITSKWSVVLGDKLEKYDGEHMSLDDFENLDVNEDYLPMIQIYTRSFGDSDTPVEERQKEVGMEDNFVEIVEVIKLESFKGYISF